jgi:hypothetical protein
MAARIDETERAFAAAVIQRHRSYNRVTKDPRLRADLPDHPNQSRTLAVGLNPTDWKHALGPWNPPNRSCVVGCDSAGEVVAVGSNVTHVKKGDKVFGFVFGTSDPYNGSYAEYVRFNKAVVVKIPDGMSAVEAASFPVRSLARSLAECLHLRLDADLPAGSKIPHLTAVQALYMRLNLPRPSSPSTEGKTVRPVRRSLAWRSSADRPPTCRSSSGEDPQP